MQKSIILDYDFTPRVRYPRESPHRKIEKMLAADAARYAATLRLLARFRDGFARIPLHADPASPQEPHWRNDWLPGLDAMSIYGLLAAGNPPVYLEIGSGNSTRFARRAVRDHHLATRIISIDPCPRAEIDGLCDQVVRDRFENVGPEIYASLPAGSLVFVDNSHRCFQNSDVTACFLDLTPNLPAGVTLGFHDIFLPYDYPATWLERYYSELYILAAFLLGGHQGYEITLPVYYSSMNRELFQAIAPVFAMPELREAQPYGTTFWMTRRD